MCLFPAVCAILLQEIVTAPCVKIGSKTLNVRGVKIDDHGDSHAKDGYCNVIKKVYVEGIVRGNSFIPAKMDIEKI